MTDYKSWVSYWLTRYNLRLDAETCTTWVWALSMIGVYIWFETSLISSKANVIGWYTLPSHIDYQEPSNPAKNKTLDVVHSNALGVPCTHKVLQCSNVYQPPQPEECSTPCTPAMPRLARKTRRGQPHGQYETSSLDPHFLRLFN